MLHLGPGAHRRRQRGEQWPHCRWYCWQRHFRWLYNHRGLSHGIDLFHLPLRNSPRLMLRFGVDGGANPFAPRHRSRDFPSRIHRLLFPCRVSPVGSVRRPIVTVPRLDPQAERWPIHSDPARPNSEPPPASPSPMNDNARRWKDR